MCELIISSLETIFSGLLLTFLLFVLNEFVFKKQTFQVIGLLLSKY